MIVRPMHENDSGQVAQIENELFADSWSERSILETLRQPQAVVFVADHADQIAGYVIVYHVIDECEIARIAVLPQMQNQGVGGQLLDHLLTWCRENAVIRIMLEVRSGNETARRFYRNQCFLEDGIRQDYYTNPREDAVLMSREVN